MPDRETTAKFNVDISKLKKGIQEANRQIRLANAEFKVASASMEKWGSSTDGLTAKITQTDKVLEQQKKILKSYEDELALVEKQYGANSKEADNARIKLENQRAAVIKTEKSLEDYKNQLTQLQEEEKAAAAAAEKENSALSTLERTIESQEKSLAELKTEYANIVLEQGKSSQAAKDMASDIEKLSSELNDNKEKLNNAEDAADKFDKSLEDTASGGLDAFTVALGNLIANVVTDAINKLKELAATTIEVGMNFDSSMSQVGAISGATGEELQALRDKAKEMGSTTKFTASEAADAFSYMAMAGWKTEDMINGIDGVLKLAAASGADLATTSDIVTDALTALGYSAGDAGRLADVMAAASSNANTNVELMGATFQYAAPIVGALGMNMEDTAVAIGLMANAGIKGDKAGTALRSILTRLSTDAGATSKSLGALGTLTENLGVEFYNTDGTVRDLSAVLNEARVAWADLSAEEQASYGKKIAGQEALSGWLAIMNASTADVNKLTEAVQNADGAANEMANTMLDNLGGDMTLLSSKLEGVQLSIYEKFEPALRDGVEVLDDLLDGVNYVVEHSTEFVAAIGAMAAGVGAYVAYSTAIKIMNDGFKSLTLVTKAAAAAQWLLNVAMTANPIGLIIAAIAALVAGFVILWNKSDKFRNFWINLWNTVKESVLGAWDSVKTSTLEAWETIKEFFANGIETVTSLWDGLKEGAINTWNSITETVTRVWENIKNAVNTAVEFINTIVAASITYLLDKYAPLINFVTTAFNIIKELIVGLSKLLKIIGTAAALWIKGNLIDPILGFFTELWQGIKDTAIEAWTAISTTAIGIWDSIVEKTTAAWEGIKNALTLAWNAIKLVFVSFILWFNDQFVTPITAAISTVWDMLTSGAQKAWEGIKSVFAPVASWFETTFKKAWEKVKKVFSAGGKVFTGIKEGIISGFKIVVNALIAGINKVIQIPFNAINNMLDKVRNFEIMGQKPFEGVVTRFEIPQIPYLASGGVLKKGQMALLEGAGAEAVIPLENNKRWINATANALRNALESEGLVATSMQQIVNNTYEFTQNNTSPKALDALTVYRETNSLLFAAQARLT